MIHYAQQRGFQNLSLDQRTFDNDHGLVRKCYLTLAHGPHIAGELHIAEEFAVFCIFFSRKESVEEIGWHLAQVHNHLHYVIRTADHSPVVVFRSLAVEKVEDGFLILHSTVVE